MAKDTKDRQSDSPSFSQISLSEPASIEPNEVKRQNVRMLAVEIFAHMLSGTRPEAQYQQYQFERLSEMAFCAAEAFLDVAKKRQST